MAANQVFRLHDGWQVFWNGRVCSPTFNSKGAAAAYLSGLARGRRPEYV